MLFLVNPLGKKGIVHEWYKHFEDISEDIEDDQCSDNLVHQQLNNGLLMTLTHKLIHAQQIFRI